MTSLYYKILCIVITLCCGCFNLTAYNINLKFNKLTLEDGLTGDKHNNYIYQDSRGFVWISSIDGLNRFDGMKIKTYGIDSGMKDAIIHSNFFEDDIGNIWFSTYEAVNCYNARLDTFYHYQVINNDSEMITQNYRVFHLNLKEKKLWLLAGSDIYALDINNPTKFEQLRFETNAQFFEVILAENGSLKKIVAFESDTTIQFIDVNDKGKTVAYPIKNRSRGVDLKNSTWLFYKGNQLTRFNDFAKDSIQFLKNDANISIYCALPYQNHLLISSVKEGVWLYNWEQEQFLKQWQVIENNDFSLLTNSPKYLYLSPGNYLWCSHRNAGINYSYLFNNNFNNPLSAKINKEVEITSIIETNEGNIWVSTRYNGIFIFDTNNKFLKKIDNPLPKSGNLGLLQLSKNKQDEVYATSVFSIFKLDLNSGSGKKIIDSYDTLELRYMTNIYPNRQLISTNKGIMELVKNAHENYTIKHCPELSAFKTFSFLQMYQTQNNKVFIPYAASQLWVYEATRDSLKLISKNDSCSLQFYGFCESKKLPGIVWAGTSKGLKVINNNNHIQPVLTANEALNYGSVYGVVEDRQGILWLTTGKGLWKYDPAEPEKQTAQFEAVDGLSGENFSMHYSVLHASNGSIWMGNNKGLVSFNPDSINTHKEIPNLYLEELLINDTQSFKDSISIDKVLALSYEQNTVTFEMTAINLYKTERNKIYYQLEGYDDLILSTRNGEKIRYTKIQPGSYKLMVQAEDVNGHKGNFEQLLHIEITPPFWQTWWFRALCLLSGLLLIYVIYKQQISKVRKEEARKRAIEQLEAKVQLEAETKKTAVEQLKNQILRTQMNPHFLFNAMNSIKSLIIKGKAKEASIYLSKFATLLRHILNNSKQEKIRLNDEIKSLENYIELEALRFTSDFNYAIQMDKTIDASFIKVPPLILQPFVENAIWHGLLPKPEGIKKLSINIIRKKDYLYFGIEDNGIGRRNAEAQSKKENQQSMGITITNDRLRTFHKKQGIEVDNEVEIIDLVDDKQQALGTKVLLKLYAPE